MATATQTITSDFNARSTALEVASAVSLQGKNAVVTGGASGLGLETSRALAYAGAMVTLAVRNLDQGNSAAVALKAEFPAAHIQVAKLDLSDLATVRQFAAGWNASGQPLSILMEGLRPGQKRQRIVRFGSAFAPRQ